MGLPGSTQGWCSHLAEIFPGFLANTAFCRLSAPIPVRVVEADCHAVCHESPVHPAVPDRLGYSRVPGCCGVSFLDSCGSQRRIWRCGCHQVVLAFSASQRSRQRQQPVLFFCGLIVFRAPRANSGRADASFPSKCCRHTLLAFILFSDGSRSFCAGFGDCGIRAVVLFVAG